MKRVTCSHVLAFILAQGLIVALPTGAVAGTVMNPLCPKETVSFNPDQGQDIVLPAGFKVSVFKSGLNAPTGIAFKGNSKSFDVYVLESGHGLPSRCNDQTAFGKGDFDPTNPLTPDIKVFDQNGTLLRTMAKPTGIGTTQTGGLLAEGPAIDIGFEKGLQGGRLFATDSNQATHTAGANTNSSRIVTVNPMTGAVTPFITRLPTGDHPTENLAFKDGFIYWSQGSTTNTGVVGKDNGGAAAQPDIPCQDIVLSQNVFDNGGGVFTSGYSKFGVTRPGATVKAFEGASHHGVCDGAVLRTKLNAEHPENVIEPFSWGYRNGYAIRFAPDDHPLAGAMLVGENGTDERGARPTNNPVEPISIAAQNPDGTPDYHGWPDRFGFQESSQAVFNPIGGPADDLCQPPNPPFPACVPLVLKEDVPVRDVLAFPPQAITSPIAIQEADSSPTGIDFVPESFIGGPVKRGAALISFEGDFGFSTANATPPGHEFGHEVKLINFGRGSGENDDQESGKPLALQIDRFAHNTIFEQALQSPSRISGRRTQLSGAQTIGRADARHSK